MLHAAAFPDSEPDFRSTKRRSLGLIGAGAFGEFILPHLTPFFDVAVADQIREVGILAARCGADAVDVQAAAARDVVLLAVPVRALEAVASEIAPCLKPGAVVVDVCSVKLKPLEILRLILPSHVRIVATHPLFGPQSGRGGISGLSIAICGSDPHTRLVERFCTGKLGLNVVRTDAERHDRQMAYVQGLTHLLARIVLVMDMPAVDHATQTYGHLQSMVEMVRHDSDELFDTILSENPFAAEVLAAFWESAARVTRLRR